MITFNQIKKNRKYSSHRTNRISYFEGCPQKRGQCVKITIKTPKKPNSAQRKVAKVRLSSNKKLVFAGIPGEGHSLQEYSEVLMRAGRIQDVPGVKFRLIRGKYDFLGLVSRKTSRSKFGTKKIAS